MLGKGDIELDTADTLKRFLTTKQQDNTGVSSGHGVELCFDSQGGDLEGALQLGDAIRALHMDTCVEPLYVELTGTGSADSMRAPDSSAPAMCASACVFAFAAGIHRTVSKDARMGMHQFVGRDGDLGQRRTQIAISELAKYLEQNGVQRKLLDIGVYVPHSQIRFLTPEEIADTNLDNTLQRYEAWQLNPQHDGKVYARVKQRNPITDTWTELRIYKNDQRARLEIIFYPSSDDTATLRRTGAVSLRPSPHDLLGLLSGADIWLRMDDQDFANVDRAQWEYRANTYVRSIEMEPTRLLGLRSAHLLEVWVLLPQINARDNPSMSFELDTLTPLLGAVFR
jgi:hypothetical protein